MRDVRLSSSGVATVTAVVASACSSKLEFCCVLIGIDCLTEHVSCCYCLDETVDGALFDPSRSRVAVWSETADGTAFALHVFTTADTWSSSFLRRFLVDRGPCQQIQRIEWAGDRIFAWVGAPHEAWAIFTANLCTATGTGEARPHGQQLEQQEHNELDASGLGRVWTRAAQLPVSERYHLNGCVLSSDGTWALQRTETTVAPSDGREHLCCTSHWRLLRLHGERGSEVPRLLTGCLAACFAGHSSRRHVDVFALRPAAGHSAGIELCFARLSEDGASPTAISDLCALETPWLSKVLEVLPLWQSTGSDGGSAATDAARRSPAVLQMAVRHSRGTPLAVWVQTQDGVCAVSAEGASVEPLDAALHRVVLSSGGFAAARDGSLLGGRTPAESKWHPGTGLGGLSQDSGPFGDSHLRMQQLASARTAPVPSASRSLHWCGAVVQPRCAGLILTSRRS